MRTVCIFILSFLFLALPLAEPGMGQTREQHKLAVVVQAGSYMNEPWLESSRGEALLKNLLMYLNTIPAQVDLQIWWTAETTTLFDKQTWPNPSQQELRPTFGGRPQPDIKEALLWLEPVGGSLLFIGDQAPQIDEKIALALKRDDVFCHVLALAPSDPEGLANMAFLGGGGYFAAPSPNQTGPFTGAALRNAVTTGRLKIITHDAQNQRLDMAVSLARGDILEKSRAVPCWRMLQLLPGGYRITWPQASALPGPAPLPERLNVTDKDAPQLNVGGTGSISVRSLDDQGQEQHWPLAVLDAVTGKLWESRRESPFTLSLPVGIYRVYSSAPIRQEWRVGLGAGENLEHVFGPKGSLMVQVPGPGKNWQVPFRLHSGPHQPALRGQSGVKLALNPGDYLLSLETIPPVIQEISIAPGQNLEIKIPEQGAIMARRAGAAPKTYFVQDERGVTLGRSAENRQVLVQPGKYWLVWENNNTRQAIEVKGGQVYMVQESDK